MRKKIVEILLKHNYDIENIICNAQHILDWLDGYGKKQTVIDDLVDKNERLQILDKLMKRAGGSFFRDVGDLVHEADRLIGWMNTKD